MGPLQAPVEEWEWENVYGAYVLDNTMVTEGEYIGSPIYYIMENNTTGISKTDIQSVSVKQEKGQLVIDSENAIANASLYNIGGVLVTASGENVIRTAALDSGIYILKVEDVKGNKTLIKVVVD